MCGSDWSRSLGGRPHDQIGFVAGAVECDLGVAAGGAIGAGERVDPQIIEFARQADRGPRLEDRIGPLVASDIPVEFVVILKKPDAVFQSVADHHGAHRIGRPRHENLQVAILSRPGRLIAKGISSAIADPLHLQEQAMGEALPGALEDRNPSVNPLPAPLEAERDRFLNDHLGRVLHADAGEKIVDRDRSSVAETRSCRDEQERPEHTGDAGGFHVRSIFALGTARSAGSESSKNSRGRKPAELATRLLGKLATAVLRSRTTAL